jgi:hypothetical protein
MSEAREILVDVITKGYTDRLGNDEVAKVLAEQTATQLLNGLEARGAYIGINEVATPEEAEASVDDQVDDFLDKFKTLVKAAIE